MRRVHRVRGRPVEGIVTLEGWVFWIVALFTAGFITLALMDER